MADSLFLVRVKVPGPALTGETTGEFKTRLMGREAWEEVWRWGVWRSEGEGSKQNASLIGMLFMFHGAQIGRAHV